MLVKGGASRRRIPYKKITKLTKTNGVVISKDGIKIFSKALMRQCEVFSKDIGRFGFKSNAAAPKFANRRPCRMNAAPAEGWKPAGAYFQERLIDLFANIAI